MTTKARINIEFVEEFCVCVFLIVKFQLDVVITIERDCVKKNVGVFYFYFALDLLSLDSGLLSNRVLCSSNTGVFC